MTKADATPEWVALCENIDDGDFDKGLGEIARTVQGRMGLVQRREARRLIVTLTKGTRVMLTNGIKPRYLEGMIGTVIKIEPENGAAVIELEKTPSPGRGRPSNNAPTKRMVIPFIHLRRIADDVTAPSELDDDEDEIGDDEDLDEEAEDDDEDDDEDDEDDDD